MKIAAVIAIPLLRIFEAAVERASVKVLVQKILEKKNNERVG